MAEKCSRLHGFLTMHSLGGGTGSGLGTAVLKLLADNYPTVDRYNLYNKNISHSFKIFIHILLKITFLIFINFILLLLLLQISIMRISNCYARCCYSPI